MGAALLLQTLAAPLGAALLSWRWPRLGYPGGALALWLVGCLLGGAYGLPVKAWQWLPLCLLVPALAQQVDKGVALVLFALLGAAAGVRTMMRTATEMNRRPRQDTEVPSGTPDTKVPSGTGDANAGKPDQE